MKNVPKHTSLLNFVRVVSLLLLLAPLFAPQLASGDSGIRIAHHLVMQAGSSPPPHQTRETIFWFEIANNNDECDEEVFIKLDSFSFSGGTATFLGFKNNLEEGYQSNLTIDMPDDVPPHRIFFGVETGEDASGCDFDSFDVRVVVCDDGPFGWFTCDLWDAEFAVRCEPPTPIIVKTHVNSAPTPPSTGERRVFGIVVRQDTNQPLDASIELKKTGSCLIGQPDNAVTFTRVENTFITLGQTGRFDFRNFPDGTYEATATWDGQTQTKPPFTIDAITPEKELIFEF